MAKGKDFYGTSVTEVIDKACKEFSASQDELDIEILETGSAGIFGLCKKKARIRVARKPEKAGSAKKKSDKAEKENAQPVAESADRKEVAAERDAAADKESEQTRQPKTGKRKSPAALKKKQPAKPSAAAETGEPAEAARQELPSEEVLAAIRHDIAGLLTAMSFPSEVTVEVVDYSVACRISGEHEEVLVGNEGRVLDSLQYLLRKMMSRRLPDRMMLSLDVGNYREQRAEDLKVRAVELAEQVKADGKTQAIAALNPSERRVVHMVLQEDKEIRSRSVGEGLFKKVLIYKPGKKKKSGSRKGNRGPSGRSSGNQ